MTGMKDVSLSPVVFRFDSVQSDRTTSTVSDSTRSMDRSTSTTVVVLPLHNRSTSSVPEYEFCFRFDSFNIPVVVLLLRAVRRKII